MKTRRSALAAIGLVMLLPVAALASEAAAWKALKTPGAVVLFRHALAPGAGDPPGMRLNDCASQRNLSDAGREQARRIGAAFRKRGIEVGAVLTSEWCRSRETAELAFPGRAEPVTAFNSFFSDLSEGPGRTAAGQKVLDAWRGPGVLFVATHFVNISALTGVAPTSGAGVVLQRHAEGWRVVGQINP